MSSISRRAPWSAVASFVALVGCGSTAVDRAAPGACVWTSSAPQAVTTSDVDRVAQAVRVLDDRLWIGFQGTSPAADSTQVRLVQLADAAGAPVGAAIHVLPAPGPFTNFSSLSLWTDPVRRLHAAAAWTERLGCQAVLLDDDARPVSELVHLGDDNCAGVVRRPDGWSYLSRGLDNFFARQDDVYPHFRAVGPRGEVLSEQQLAPDDGTSAAARHVYDDGSFVYVRAGVPGEANRIAVLVNDAQGRPTAPVSGLAPVHAGSLVQLLRMVPDDDTLLIAWIELAPGAASSDLVIVRTSSTGAPMGAPRVVAQVRVALGSHPELGLAVSRGVPALLWAPFPSDHGGALHLATLDPRTLAPAPTVDVATALYPSFLYLRDTSQGFVAVFSAIAPPARTQVWTAAWRCVAPR